MPKLKKGFTLIELLVVISIIGILATIVAANLNSARARARDLKRKQELRELQSSLQLYYNTYQAFPTAASGRYIPHCDSANCDPGELFAVNGITYMKSMPEYQYANSGDGGYYLKIELENPSDPDLATSQAACPGSSAAATEYVVCP
jgi:prepilin-type N-terminal cleavage/methylation domain-containing protein